MRKLRHSSTSALRAPRSSRDTADYIYQAATVAAALLLLLSSAL
ncbi:hypothetical protein [Silvibacterium sp.]